MSDRFDSVGRLDPRPQRREKKRDHEADGKARHEYRYDPKHGARGPAHFLKDSEVPLTSWRLSDNSVTTEMADTTSSDVKLTDVHRRFILHWGEMGARWGINRTVAQIHALLYLSPRPLHAEEIAATLSVARSNVSNSLRELQGWGIVRVVHLLGDRRDHFESLADVFQMFEIILAERKRREVDPTLEMLRNCLDEGKADAFTSQRITAMLQFFETMTGFYDDLQRMPKGALSSVVKLRGKVRKLLVMKGGHAS
jgi:DNA-binding transcriptional regulator GbsR (MarR family)